jgi:hypothetical protein
MNAVELDILKGGSPAAYKWVDSTKDTFPDATSAIDAYYQSLKPNAEPTASESVGDTTSTGSGVTQLPSTLSNPSGLPSVQQEFPVQSSLQPSASAQFGLSNDPRFQSVPTIVNGTQPTIPTSTAPADVTNPMTVAGNGRPVSYVNEPIDNGPLATFLKYPLNTSLAFPLATGEASIESGMNAIGAKFPGVHSMGLESIDPSTGKPVDFMQSFSNAWNNRNVGWRSIADDPMNALMFVPGANAGTIASKIVEGADAAKNVEGISDAARAAEFNAANAGNNITQAIQANQTAGQKLNGLYDQASGPTTLAPLTTVGQNVNKSATGFAEQLQSQALADQTDAEKAYEASMQAQTDHNNAAKVLAIANDVKVKNLNRANAYLEQTKQLIPQTQKSLDAANQLHEQAQQEFQSVKDKLSNIKSTATEPWTGTNSRGKPIKGTVFNDPFGIYSDLARSQLQQAEQKLNVAKVAVRTHTGDLDVLNKTVDLHNQHIAKLNRGKYISAPGNVEGSYWKEGEPAGTSNPLQVDEPTSDYTTTLINKITAQQKLAELVDKAQKSKELANVVTDAIAKTKAPLPQTTNTFSIPGTGGQPSATPLWHAASGYESMLNDVRNRIASFAPDIKSQKSAIDETTENLNKAYAAQNLAKQEAKEKAEALASARSNVGSMSGISGSIARQPYDATVNAIQHSKFLRPAIGAGEGALLAQPVNGPNDHPLVNGLLGTVTGGILNIPPFARKYEEMIAATKAAQPLTTKSNILGKIGKTSALSAYGATQLAGKALHHPLVSAGLVGGFALYHTAKSPGMRLLLANAANKLYPGTMNYLANDANKLYPGPMNYLASKVHL